MEFLKYPEYKTGKIEKFLLKYHEYKKGKLAGFPVIQNNSLYSSKYSDYRDTKKSNTFEYEFKKKKNGGYDRRSAIEFVRNLPTDKRVYVIFNNKGNYKVLPYKYKRCVKEKSGRLYLELEKFDSMCREKQITKQNEITKQ